MNAMQRTSATSRSSVSGAASRRPVAAAFAACLALGALGTLTAASTAAADDGGTAVLPTGKPSSTDLAAARQAATSPATLETLSRFFARDGAVARSAAEPRAEGSTVPVLTLAPEFVAGKAGAAVARTEFLATKAVSSDGQQASVWAAPLDDRWQVVNIASGDDEFRYARRGADLLPGGTVFREPQIDAWFVSKGTRVLPLDEDAARAVGAKGTTLDAYRARVQDAYGDKLPGSGYAKKGFAGGYSADAGQESTSESAESAEATKSAEATGATVAREDRGPVSIGTVTAGAGAVLALTLCGATAARLRRRT
ncbi:hypothetical protein AB0D49_29465 [Streptomyces sp. NPDC048290]|uniref:hypothetical protein n=1 Tax=Streptomyces sp. NPDC048290 TaxID=3155811 RepID=UPI0034150453